MISVWFVVLGYPLVFPLGTRKFRHRSGGRVWWGGVPLNDETVTPVIVAAAPL